MSDGSAMGPRCGARTRSGTECSHPAGYGTDHQGVGRCKHHGGSTPSGIKHASRLIAERSVIVMGQQLDIDPHEALLACVRITAGEVAYASAMVGELEDREAVTAMVTTRTADGPAGELNERTERPAELHVWIRVRQDAVDRMARYSKMALDAGVAERQVRLAERYGTTIARLLSGVLDDLALTDEQRDRAPAIVRRHLELLETGATALT